MTSFDANELFRLDSARQNEAQRRLMLLGDLANERYDRERFLDRSRDVINAAAKNTNKGR